MRSAEQSASLLFLAQFQTAPVDQQIIDKAGGFYRKWKEYREKGGTRNRVLADF